MRFRSLYDAAHICGAGCGMAAKSKEMTKEDKDLLGYMAKTVIAITLWVIFALVSQ
jgi:hypothetical protein